MQALSHLKDCILFATPQWCAISSFQVGVTTGFPQGVGVGCTIWVESKKEVNILENPS